jgi:cytochrome c oxidase subunit 2
MAVYIAIATFAIKYKRKSDDEVPVQIEGHLPLEIAWSIIPLGIVMIMFAAGAKLFYDLSNPPADAMNFSVVGKQWMWKVQHPSGKREINELHIPLGQSVKLTITSEDVLHSFYIPAFRAKMDAVPGRYTTSWFEATKTGQFHIFCTEYCGLDHSRMIGRVVVLEPADYERWLRTGSALASVSNDPPEVAGAQLFQEQRCQTCHETKGIMAPVLVGLFGHEIKLQNGQTIVMDEAYIRESILNPAAKVVAGYQPVMPTYQGQVTEEGILQLIAYVKSLAGTAAPAGTNPLSPGEAQAAPSDPSTSPPTTETPSAAEPQTQPSDTPHDA